MFWILIMTLASAGSMYDGKAIHSIPAFSSQAACEQAGEAWVSKLDETDKFLASWVCVSSDGQ